MHPTMFKLLFNIIFQGFLEK